MEILKSKIKTSASKPITVIRTEGISITITFIDTKVKKVSCTITFMGTECKLNEISFIINIIYKRIYYILFTTIKQRESIQHLI